ncbi:AraC family transcriptional regulator [Xanthomonas sp. 10-10]|uniref:AraC family transcriptional regulator n=1 Tax=Xanthomonas sp. 10-10 TaxID=3115848 RepID=A0AAU7PDP0_9XANT
MALKGLDITHLGYAPSGRELDVEVLLFADIVRRSPIEKVRATHRYDFHMLVLVTDGICLQMVDFEPVPCAAGSVVVLRPGQVHSFGDQTHWNGWLVFFRSEFLPAISDVPSNLMPLRMLERMPVHRVVCEDDFALMTNAVMAMGEDAKCDASTKVVHTLLRYQLCTLILRLDILDARRSVQASFRSSTSKRFAKFNELLQTRLARWHAVNLYADALGCSEKSLNRATKDAVGLSAKEVIVQRLILEAKRLLAHTDRPIYRVADSLGFEESTNFSKFFRNYVGQGPAEFRSAHR